MENNLKNARATSGDKKSTADKLRNRQTKTLEETRFTRLLWNLTRN